MKESAWNVVLKYQMKNVQIVTILRNNSYVYLNTEKSGLIIDGFKIYDFNNKLNFSSIPF